jgi:hypothetical protein
MEPIYKRYLRENSLIKCGCWCGKFQLALIKFTNGVPDLNIISSIRLLKNVSHFPFKKTWTVVNYVCWQFFEEPFSTK